MEWLSIVRWIHVFSVASWLGEVITINFVIVPAVMKTEGQARLEFLANVFPRIFKLASVLSLTAVATGLVLLFGLYRGHFGMLLGSSRGIGLIVALTLGILLTAFHFLAEPRLDGMICNARDESDIVLGDRVVMLLKVVPRVGLGVLASAFVLMVYSAHGL